MENSCPAPYAGPAGMLLAGLMQNLFLSDCLLGNPNDYPDDYGQYILDNEEFDFIVVGAGAAGSAVASRLAENPEFDVLLLEAGGNPNPTSDVPYEVYKNVVSTPDILWQYEPYPNNYSLLSLKDHRYTMQKGKVLGGCTTINVMMFIRGNKQDYDDWESYGNEGWGYRDVLPYFKKLEDYGEDNEYHSSTGPVSTEYFGSTPNLENIKNIMCDGYEEIGLPRNDDVNGEHQVGCTIIRGLLTDGTRANAAKMYLSNQPNLKVVKHALVEKVIIENETAVGVIFHREGQSFNAYVRKEVILSAGVMESPHILMLSGVGPQEELEKHGIEVKVNSSGVGKNLHDHFGYHGELYSIQKENAGGYTNETTNDEFNQYLQTRTGLYASIGVFDVFSFVDTVSRSEVPDLQYFHTVGNKDNTDFALTTMRFFGFSDHYVQQLADVLEYSDTYLPIPVLLQPKSRGELLLKSADITDNPIVDTRYLSDSEDIDTMIRAIEISRNATKSSAFSVLDPEERFIKTDACSGFDEDSREYLECQIRHFGTSLYHHVGTCKMGPSTDPGAVVDNVLRVYGVSNLRVADCSIMPKIVRGNTAVPAMMIGERAADFIKMAWAWL